MLGPARSFLFTFPLPLRAPATPNHGTDLVELMQGLLYWALSAPCLLEDLVLLLPSASSRVEPPLSLSSSLSGRGLWDSRPLWQVPLLGFCPPRFPAKGRSLTLGRCLLLLLFLLSLPVPRLGSEDGERTAAFSLQRLGHLGLAPQDGKGGGGSGGYGGRQWGEAEKR